MDNRTKYIIVLVVLLGLGTTIYYSTNKLSTIVSGYGGITAEIIAASARPADGIDGDTPVTVQLNGTKATVDPERYVFWPFFTDPTIVECEIQGKLNILQNELVGTRNQTIDNGDGTYTHKLWDVRDVYLDMGVVVRTKAGGGLHATYDAVFTIKIEENQFNVFDAPDEVIAYIMEVYTLDIITADDEGKTEGSPTSSGYYFPLETLGENPVPQWLIDGGYQGDVLKQFSAVSFNVEASYMEPTTGWYVRYEHELSWKIGVTARVFGYWEDTGTNKDFEPPGGEKPWWEEWLENLGNIGSGTINSLIIMAGVVLIVYVVVKVVTARRD